MKKGKFIVASCMIAATTIVSCGGEDTPAITPAVDSMVAKIDSVVKEVNVGKLMLEDDIVINAPKAKVWEVLSKLDNVHEYGADVTEVVITSDAKTGIGAKRTCTMLDGGKLDEVVTAWEEGVSYTQAASATPEEGNPMAAQWVFSTCDGTFKLSEEGEGTKVTMIMELETSEEANVGDEMMKGIGESFKFMQSKILSGLKAYIEDGKVMTMEDKVAFQKEWEANMAAMMQEMPKTETTTTTTTTVDGDKIIEKVTIEKTH